MFKGYPDDERLLADIGKGDKGAFSILYNRYRHKVYAYALRVIKSPVLAEDILHDVFLKLWLHKSAAAIDNLDAYLQVATRNLAFNVLRKQKLEALYKQYVRNDEEVYIADTTDNHVHGRETASLIDTAKKMLPPQQRMVYELCKEKGLKYEEVAHQLSISKLTVKTHMQLALRFLKAYLTAHTDTALLTVAIIQCYFF